jgi:hypothetical protein
MGAGGFSEPRRPRFHSGMDGGGSASLMGIKPVLAAPAGCWEWHSSRGRQKPHGRSRYYLPPAAPCCQMRVSDVFRYSIQVYNQIHQGILAGPHQKPL